MIVISSDQLPALSFTDLPPLHTSNYGKEICKHTALEPM